MFQLAYVVGDQVWGLDRVLDEFLQLYRTLSVNHTCHIGLRPDGELAIYQVLSDGLEVTIPWTEFVRDFLPEVPDR